MAMLPAQFKDRISSSFKGMSADDMKSPTASWRAFVNALCDYFEENMQLTFSWVATQTIPPPPTGTIPDPMVTFTCKVKCPNRTSFVQPSNHLAPITPYAVDLIACKFFQLNTNFGNFIPTFIPEYPAGFSLPPLPIYMPTWMMLRPVMPPAPITRVSCQITASGLTDVDQALFHLANEMLLGLKMPLLYNVTPRTGTHVTGVTFAGSAILTNIM